MASPEPRDPRPDLEHVQVQFRYLPEDQILRPLSDVGSSSSLKLVAGPAPCPENLLGHLGRLPSTPS